MNIANCRAKLHILPLFYDWQISVLNASYESISHRHVGVQVVASLHLGIAGGIEEPFAGHPVASRDLRTNNKGEKTTTISSPANDTTYQSTAKPANALR